MLHAIVVLYMSRTLGLGPATIGFVFGAGAVGALLGVRPTLWVAAAGGLLCVAWLLPSPIRRMRTPPAQAA